MRTTISKEKNSQTKDSHEPIKPCQIFLIEDDADDRLLQRRELEKSEHVDVVLTFKDGKELTDYMKRQGFMDRSVILFEPLLILIDLEMPRKDGFAVLEELKSDPFLADIPMVVVTANKSKEKMFKAFQLGANGLFQKPLDVDLLNEFFSKTWQWPPKDLWG